MQYITRNDIDEIFLNKDLIDLTATEPRATEPNEQRIQSVIDYINNLIDDSLRGRYDLPFASVPVVLKNIGKAIAKVNIQEYGNAVSEQSRKTYDSNIALLKEYQNGQKRLDIQAPAKQISVGIFTNKRRSKINDGILNL